ncbi:MAG: extracellular solute-binding protein [Hyphomicrobiales bacterium]|nr:extracellular solute-binding protein [Hyphomicrobiales bacterium]
MMKNILPSDGRGRRLLLAAALAASAAGAASAKDAANFQLVHPWVAPPEQKALGILRSTIEKAGLTWVDDPVSTNFDGVRQKLAALMALHLPPTAVFWIGGADAGDLLASKIIRVVPAQGEGEKPAFRFDPEIERLVATEGGYTALPLNIHTQNHIVYNRAVFDRLKLGAPKSWEEFLQMAPAIRASGVVPLAMSDERWQIRFLILSILVEQIDPMTMERLLTGVATERAAMRAGLVNSFRLLKRLHEFANADNHALPWGRVVEMVQTGKAASAVLGDFMSPAFDNPAQFSCGLPPGNKYIIWSFDVLLFPTLPTPEQTHFQNVAIGALNTQSFLDEYASAKGGLPVVQGAQPAGINYCSNVVLKLWNQGLPKVNVTPLVWRNAFNVIAAAAEMFWSKPNMTAEEAADLVFRMIGK